MCASLFRFLAFINSWGLWSALELSFGHENRPVSAPTVTKGELRKNGARMQPIDIDWASCTLLFKRCEGRNEDMEKCRFLCGRLSQCGVMNARCVTTEKGGSSVQSLHLCRSRSWILEGDSSLTFMFVHRCFRFCFMHQNGSLFHSRTGASTCDAWKIYIFLLCMCWALHYTRPS